MSTFNCSFVAITFAFIIRNTSSRLTTYTTVTGRNLRFCLNFNFDCGNLYMDLFVNIKSRRLLSEVLCCRWTKCLGFVLLQRSLLHFLFYKLMRYVESNTFSYLNCYFYLFYLDYFLSITIKYCDIVLKYRKNLL